VVDLPLLLSQTNYNWSLAPIEANVDRARVDMVAQCGAGGSPNWGLIRTHIRICCCFHFLIMFYYSCFVLHFVCLRRCMF
jgi:hypothetical protein